MKHHTPPFWFSGRLGYRGLGKNTCCWALLLALSLFLLPLVGQAQVNTGAILGTVSDPSGGVVPNAAVTLMNTQTGVTSSTKTNQSGNYAFRNLIPGSYKITVRTSGFKTYAVTNIPVQVAQTTTRDVTLSVGKEQTTVNVSAPAVALQTKDSALGEVIGEHLVNNLPLNGRNFTQLLTLTAGTASTGTSGMWGNPQSGSFILPSINGQNAVSTQWLLNGTNNSSNFGGGISVAPIIDDIQEFKVVSHTDSVEYGGVLGGYVDVVTKGGTNHFHGTAWEFLRNDKFDARNPYLANVNPLKQNQFGGNFGGPIIRNRAFFFGAYQGFRQHVGSTALYLVPTPAMENGDFSGQQPLYNPYSTRPDPNNPGSYIRDRFMCSAPGVPVAPNADGTQTGGTPCNYIPQQLMSPLAETYVKTLFPAPVSTGIPGTNGIDNTPNIFNQNFFEGRGDYQITSAQSAMVSYNHISSPQTTSGGMAGSTALYHSFGYELGADYTWTMSPTTVFRFTFGRTYINFHLSSKWDNLGSNYDSFVNSNWSWACGRSTGFGSKNCWVPMMQIPGYAAVNNFDTYVPQTNIWQFTPALTHVSGNHTFKVGGSLARHRIAARTQRAFEYFGSNQTADLNNPGSTGSAIASFFLGIPYGGDLTDTHPGLQQPTWSGGFYAQDQWQINKRLTFNYGIRWDLFNPGQYGMPGTSNYYSGVMDMLTGQYVIAANPGACSVKGQAPCIPTAGGILPANVVVAPNHKIFQNVYDNFAPRLGIAYQLNQKTVLRAGIGRFYDTWSDIDLAVFQSEGLWPDSQGINSTTLNQTYVEPNHTIANPLDTNGQQLLPDPNGPFNISGQTFRDPNLKDPWTDQWNVGIQRQLGSETLLSVNYVGSNGKRIPVGGTYGSAVTPGPGNPRLRQPFPYILPTGFTRDWGRNWYEALQVTLRRRFSSGLTYSLAYTWSKAEDLGSTDGLSGNQQNPYDLWQEKGVMDTNLPQVFAAGWVYQLPFGKGSRFAAGSRAVNAVIGGWNLNGMLTLTSGDPYGLYLCGDVANVGRTDCYERPNIVGDPNLSNPTPAGWFNPSAFATPAQYTYGNAGRNILKGDGFSNLDLSLLRNIQIREGYRLQFRFDAFNAFNTPTWGNPVSQLGLPGQTGHVYGTRSTEREIQLAMKLYF